MAPTSQSGYRRAISFSLASRMRRALLEGGQVMRVGDIFDLAPATSRLIDAVPHTPELLRAVRTGVDDELHPGVAGHLNVHVVQIQATRLGIDFQHEPRGLVRP